MTKTLRTSGDYTIKAGDGFNSGSGTNTINLDSLLVSVSGNLTVAGTTTTVNTTNTVVADNIIELNSGISASSNDAGIIIERGSTGDNAAIVWDESADTFILGTTTATGADKSGGISVAAGSLTIGNLITTDITANSLTTNVITSNGSNADISVQASGTGSVLLGNFKFSGTSISSDDSTSVNINEGLIVDGTLNVSGEATLAGINIQGTSLSSADSTSLNINENLTVEGNLDMVGGGNIVTGDNRIVFADSGTVSFFDFTVTQFGQDNNTVLASVKSINLFLDSNGGDTGQAFRIYNNTNPDSSPTENTYIFKVQEDGDLFVTGDTSMTGNLTVTDVTANSLTTNVIGSNGSNAAITISSSGTGDINLDSGGDFVIDVDGADIKLQDDSTEFGRISRVSSDLVIKSMGTNNDILLKGLDGSDTITALQLDMSENGNAIFSGNVTAADITANSLTTNVISSNGSNADISVQASGTGDVVIGALRVKGTSLSSSDSTTLNVNDGLVVDGTLTSQGNIFGVQTLTGSGSTGVISLTETVTLLITTGGSQAFSLADGVEGQIKIISMKTDGGSGIVTPANFVNGTTITFDDVEDTVTLLYQSTGWVALARQNATFG